MEWQQMLTQFYHVRTTTYCGNVSCSLLLVALAASARYADNHVNSRGYFTCNTLAPNKTFIEAESFDKYGQDYVDSFPPMAFVGLYVLLLLVITAYTVFAARYVFAVEEQKNDPNRLQECRQSFKSTSSVFIFYVLQITLKTIFLAAFVGLQRTLRPRSFPSVYKSHGTTPVDCKDDFYKENSNLNHVTLSLNAAIILSSLTELIYVLKSCCSRPRRLNNFTFSCFFVGYR